MSGVKSKTPEEMMDSMPYPDLTTCDGEPNYKLLVCAIDFIVTANTGILAIEAGTTAVDSNNQNITYTDNKRCYQEWQSLEQACKNQFIKSIQKST